MEFGQLGDGVIDKRARDLPQRVESLFGTPIIDIACGLDHSIALTADGDVLTWGYNREGQLGLGQDEEDVSIPTRVSGIKKKIKRVYAGLDFCIALTEDGDYYAWGFGEKWQLGNKERDIKLRPVLCGLPEEKIIDFALGGASVIAISEVGHVYSWGDGSNGRLGHGDEETVPWAKLIDSLALLEAPVVKVAGKGGHHLALTSAGEVYSWGLGRSGRLGQGGDDDFFQPTLIKALAGKKAVQIAAGMDHSLVVVEAD